MLCILVHAYDLSNIFYDMPQTRTFSVDCTVPITNDDTSLVHRQLQLMDDWNRIRVEESDEIHTLIRNTLRIIIKNLLLIYTALISELIRNKNNFDHVRVENSTT